jgi:lysophospholipase L1-like esterase
LKQNVCDSLGLEVGAYDYTHHGEGDILMKLAAQIFAIMTCAVTLTFCAGSRDRPIKFIYLALGASDAVGVGAIPLTDGYVYLIKRDLDRRMPGVFLMNLGVPAARIDLIKEEVRLAAQARTKAHLVTLWTGANDLVNGDDPKIFQEDLRALLGIVKDDISKTIVMANLPDLTKLPRFRDRPSPWVTAERIAAYNRAIMEEAKRVDAKLLDFFAIPVQDDLVFDVDGFHPNNAGHQAIAREFLRVILPTLQ